MQVMNTYVKTGLSNAENFLYQRAFIEYPLSQARRKGSVFNFSVFEAGFK